GRLMKKTRPNRANQVGSADLRQRAEERLEARETHESTAAGGDPARLVHEIRVHEIELEMQNDELRAARRELEVTLNRYRELFDFAPIGLAVVTKEGTIRELTLAGARLLGMERWHLINRRFAMFISPQEREDLSDFIVRVLTDPADEPEHSSRE